MKLAAPAAIPERAEEVVETCSQFSERLNHFLRFHQRIGDRQVFVQRGDSQIQFFFVTSAAAMTKC